MATVTATPAPAKVQDLEGVLEEWATKRGRPAISIVTTGRSPLSEDHVLALWSKLVIQYDSLDLIIHSNGGDPHSAYQIVELIRRHMNDAKSGLTAVVPYRAASAATLMCLGCDEIMLDELAHLGPLDMQVYEDRKGGTYRYKSALNPGMALRQLNEFALASLRSTKIALTKDGVLPDEAYEIAQGLVVGLFTPLYAQVNPERLAEYGRALDVTLEYATSLLKRHSALPPSEQKTIAEKLVKGYPSHHYNIDFHEARDLGLTIVPVPDALSFQAIELLRYLHSADSGVLLVNPTPPVPTPEAKPAPRRKKGSTRAKRTPALVSLSNGKKVSRN